MTQSAPAMGKAPGPILFATDLSSRCDRALDRSLLLAGQWGVRVIVMTVVEPGDHFHSSLADALAPSGGTAIDRALRVAEQRLCADLAVEAPALPLTVRVEAGGVADSILAACDAEAAGMVVTGVARNEALSRVVLGSTVDTLARRAAVPLLVVRSLARTPYRDVVVASDFSPSSRHALETAARLFPEARFTLFHAFGNPYPTLAGMSLARARSEGYELAQKNAASFLQSCQLPAPVRDSIQLSMAYGDAADLIRQRGITRPADLVVLGTERRRGLVGWLIGSVAQRILELAENDVLIVPHTSA